MQSNRQPTNEDELPERDGFNNDLAHRHSGSERSPLKGVSTARFSGNNLVADQTVRKQYSQTGSYFGVVPKKLANGRLLWPDVIVTRIGIRGANDDIFGGERER